MKALSPAMKRRVRAQRRAKSSIIPATWGYYPSTRCCQDGDPEVRFRALVDLLIYSVMNAIAVRGDLQFAERSAIELLDVIQRKRAEGVS